MSESATHCTVVVTGPADAARVSIAGNVTELADFSPLEGLSGHVTVDVGGIERFNSMGVRNWVNAVGRLSTRTHRIDFLHANDVLLSQALVIHGFLGRGVVQSLLAHHQCPACDYEVEVTLERERDFPQGEPINRTAPLCPKCSERMVLDAALYLTGL